MSSAPAIIDRPSGTTNFAMNSVRIFAALIVVISHARALFFVDYSDSDSNAIVTQALYAVTALGHQAVIVFFVLSGYWVGGSVIRGVTQGRFNASAYAVARLTRLWLVLLPAILLTQLLDRAGSVLFPQSDVYAGSPAYHTVVPPDGPLPSLGWTATIGNFLFLEDLYVPTLGTNTPLWSLAAEFWYYLLFPAILLALTAATRWEHRVIAAVLSVAAIAVVSFATQPDPTNVLLLFPVWLLGAFVAWRKKTIARLLLRLSTPRLAILRWLSVGLVLGTAVLDSRFGGLFGTAVLAGATTLMLATFVVDVSEGWPQRALTPFSWSAEWSYSLYATHLPVLAFLAAMIVPEAADRWQLTPVTFLVLLGITAIPAAVAVGFFYVSERHTGRVRSLLTRSRTKASVTTS